MRQRSHVFCFIVLCLCAMQAFAQVCQNAKTPTFTLGVAKNVPLPGGGILRDGDLFYLGADNVTVYTDSDGASFFNFDSSPSGTALFGAFSSYASTTGLGFSATKPNSIARAISTQDSFWDFTFQVASSGITAGDKLSVYIRQPNDSDHRVLYSFVVNPSGTGLIVQTIWVGVDMSVIGIPLTTVGTTIPFTEAAGTAGQKTKLISTALPMDGSLPDCGQLVIEIERSSGTGKLTVGSLVSVVTRSPGTLKTGTGVQTGQSGQYPAALVCNPPTAPTCGPQFTCDYYICFRNPNDWSNRMCFPPYNQFSWSIIPPGNIGAPQVTFSCNTRNASIYSMLTCNSTGMCFGTSNTLKAWFISSQMSVQFSLGQNFYWLFEPRTHIDCYVPQNKKLSVYNVRDAQGQPTEFVITGRPGSGESITITPATSFPQLWQATQWALTYQQFIGGTDATDIKRQWLINLMQAFNQCTGI